MAEPMTEERLTELEALDRGPCLYAVRELAAEVRRLKAQRDWLLMPGSMRLVYIVRHWWKSRKISNS